METKKQNNQKIKIKIKSDDENNTSPDEKIK